MNNFLIISDNLLVAKMAIVLAWTMCFVLVFFLGLRVMDMKGPYKWFAIFITLSYSFIAAPYAAWYFIKKFGELDNARNKEQVVIRDVYDERVNEVWVIMQASSGNILGASNQCFASRQMAEDAIKGFRNPEGFYAHAMKVNY